MPMGKPSAGGGGGAFGLAPVIASNSVGGTSLNTSSQQWDFLPYTERWLLNTASFQTFARATPYLSDDPLINRQEPVPNYPVVGSDTNCIYMGSSRLNHFFNLRVLGVNQFWRTPHDFSSWTNLALPTFSQLSARSLGFMPDTIFGDLLWYPNTDAGPALQMHYSSDEGANWLPYTFPGGVFGSVWQAQFALMTTPNGQAILGLRDAVALIGKPVIVVPAMTILFPVTSTPGPPVGSGGNDYTAWGVAPDGRMAAGTNNGRLNWSLNGGVNWQAAEGGGSPVGGQIRCISWNPADDYFYIQRNNHASRTLDFVDFEQLAHFGNSATASFVNDFDEGLRAPDNLLYTAQNITAANKQYWKVI